MKTTCLILTFAALSATPALSQGGPLTPPPGVPAPTMKTLDQIEPRIPLVEGSPGITVTSSIVINQPGSYYLTKDLVTTLPVNPIEIQASGVTIDLMGHSIIYQGSGNAGAAIFIADNVKNVTVENGHLISTTTYNGSTFVTGGFSYGLWAFPGTTNIIARNLSIRGTRLNGILFQGNGNLVKDCLVTFAGGIGISAPNGLVESCVVTLTVGFGIVAESVVNCRVNEATGIGINASLVVNSSAISTTETGILASRAITNSYGESNNNISSKNGIDCPDGTVTASYGKSAGGRGINSDSVTGSKGISTGSSANAKGIQAQIVSDSRGQSTAASGGEGIRADTLAMNCVAQSSGTTALYATRAATNCYGFTNATNSSAHGIFSEGSVNNSYGWSNGNGGGDGINAQIITGSYGNTAAGARHGINARIVNSSYGRRASSVAGKFGLLANRASLSEGLNGESITHRFDMP